MKKKIIAFGLYDILSIFLTIFFIIGYFSFISLEQTSIYFIIAAIIIFIYTFISYFKFSFRVIYIENDQLKIKSKFLDNSTIIKISDIKNIEVVSSNPNFQNSTVSSLNEVYFHIIFKDNSDFYLISTNLNYKSKKTIYDYFKMNNIRIEDEYNLICKHDFIYFILPIFNFLTVIIFIVFMIIGNKYGGHTAKIINNEYCIGDHNTFIIVNKSKYTLINVLSKITIITSIFSFVSLMIRQNMYNKGKKRKM